MASRDLAVRILQKLTSSLEATRNTYYTAVSDCQIPTLWYLLELFLGQRNHGTLVEVGANDGVSVSNTLGLLSRGWTGYLIEPIPEIAHLCRRNTARFPAASVHQVAISDGSRDTLRIHLAGLLSSANSEVVSEYSDIGWAQKSLSGQIVEVPCMTLNAFLTHTGVDPAFDLLVVDVEGHEAEVFEGFDLDYWRPSMIIAELADTHPDLHSTAQGDYAVAQHLLARGYSIAYKDHINTVFVEGEIYKKALVKESPQKPVDGTEHHG